MSQLNESAASINDTQTFGVSACHLSNIARTIVLLPADLHKCLCGLLGVVEVAGDETRRAHTDLTARRIRVRKITELGYGEELHIERLIDNTVSSDTACLS
jgi:hypothetical protein